MTPRLLARILQPVRVTIAGASGFIGRHLAAALRARGEIVVETSLRDPIAAASAAAAADVLVNLAGEKIVQRWTAQAKQAIIESRTTAVTAMFRELESAAAKPAAYVGASAIGYYGTSESRTFTEEDGPGSDFPAHICVEWERAAAHARDLGMRTCAVRTGLVLGNDGGILAQLLPIFRSGTGGRAGSGRQWFSWIHLDDAVGLYLSAIDRLAGPINATAPNPVRNAEFSQTLGRVLARPAVLPVPAFAIKAMLGEAAMLVLEGQRVLPARAQSEGYAFKFPELEPALRQLLT
jgi:uncharacterized protein (TIGR01777 family)